MEMNKLKILHLCLGSFYIDNYSYQENLLPKYHKKIGCDVEIVASLMTFDENGKPAFLEKGSTYVNENGIKVTRLDNMKPVRLNRILKNYIGTYEAIKSAAPDIIFVHGCQFKAIDEVVQYVKEHKDVKVYVDNHADYSNSATNFLSKNILHKILWKRCAHLIEPYAEKFYGVLPARVDFLQELYGLPKDKCELLVMGVDDEKAEEAEKPEIKAEFRRKHDIKEDDFLIMTGGKIDLFKQQTLLLMDAVNNINDPKVKLIVFGSVVNELKQEVEKRCSDRVQYVGWIKAEESYKFFAACDLAVFPGRHSVFWEQVTGQGIPMIVKHWEGTTHVDLGGNVKFLYKDSEEEIRDAITSVVNNKQEYDEMKRVAKEKGKDVFSYRNIAKRSIEAS